MQAGLFARSHGFFAGCASPGHARMGMSLRKARQPLRGSFNKLCRSASCGISCVLWAAIAAWGSLYTGLHGCALAAGSYLRCASVPAWARLYLAEVSGYQAQLTRLTRIEGPCSTVVPPQQEAA